MTTLSAIPITGAAFTFLQVMLAGNFAMRLNEAFEEMESSLNKDHKDYSHCLAILEKTDTASTVIKSTSLGFSLAALIPGIGFALLPPRIAASVSAMVLIRDGLEVWQNSGCQYATTRDCNL